MTYKNEIKHWPTARQNLSFFWQRGFSYSYRRCCFTRLRHKFYDLSLCCG